MFMLSLNDFIAEIMEKVQKIIKTIKYLDHQLTLLDNQHGGLVMAIVIRVKWALKGE